MKDLKHLSTMEPKIKCNEEGLEGLNLWDAIKWEVLVNTHGGRKGILGKHPQLGPEIPWISNATGQPDVRSTRQLVKD